MSRISLHRPRLSRSVWDRPATDTRLLPNPFPNTVSPSPLVFPKRNVHQVQRPLCPPAAGFPRPVDARDFSRMYPRYAVPCAEADACPDSPQMFPRLLPLRVSPSAVDACLGSPQMYSHSQLPLRASPSAVDARAPARMFFRPAVPGVEMDACAKAQAIPHAPAPEALAGTAEGALAHPSLSTPTPSRGETVRQRRIIPDPGRAASGTSAFAGCAYGVNLSPGSGHSARPERSRRVSRAEWRGVSLHP